MRLHLATGNAKKLVELRRILVAAGLDHCEVVCSADLPAYPEPVEDGRTFADNALIKARAGAAATGLITVADDSGLTVDELGGMPGVLSARWSGRHGDDAANNELLLAQMQHVPDSRRGAGFVSVCALVTPTGCEHVSSGEWRGWLLREGRGENGFGYDPLFLPGKESQSESGTAVRGDATVDLSRGRSSAQLTPEEKDALSHRHKALEGLVPVIRRLVEADEA